MSTATPPPSRFRRLLHSRRTHAAFLLVVILLSIISYVRYQHTIANAELGRRFVARFNSSFRSGLVKLSGEPEIEFVERLVMREFGPFSIRPPGVHEYVVTAKFVEGGNEKWGRWLYTCNGNHDEGIFKFSQSTAVQREALAEFPMPLQSYIQWTTALVDGIPATAGPSLTIVSVSSPVKATDPLVVAATALPHTECRIEVFPANAILSQPAPKHPDPDGGLTWILQLNPQSAGSRLSIHIHCAESRGAMTLENTTRTSAEVLP